MIEIKCTKDIRELRGKFPKPLLHELFKDLVITKLWVDSDNSYTLEKFNADYFHCGHIVILEGMETKEQLVGIGLSDGFDGVVPESIDIEKLGDALWVRLEVVYTDSCSMLFWIRKDLITNGNLRKLLERRILDD